MTNHIKRMDTSGAANDLAASPELVAFRDPAGRNWLHLTCSIDVTKRRIDPLRSIEMADMLLAEGLPLDEPAFMEGTWEATPLWYTISRGRNLLLARHLLTLGCSPEHCLWAALWWDETDTITLLLEHGASLEAVAENETPLLGAIKVSRLNSARTLVRAGADPDYIDHRGYTALHYLLKKNADIAFFELMVDAGARGDIPGPDGRTAIEALKRKRDKAFHGIAERLKH
ncbi:MAG: hypothetical protein AAF525_04810 [Pseudomonadota bacterium]